MKQEKKQEKQDNLSELVRFIVEKGGDATMIPAKDIVTAE